MRILIDECLPAALKGTLTALGHECETVSTRKTSGESDLVVPST